MTGAMRHPVLEGNRSSNHLIMPVAYVGEHGARGEVLAAGDSHEDVVQAGPGHAQVHYGRQKY